MINKSKRPPNSMTVTIRADRIVQGTISADYLPRRFLGTISADYLPRRKLEPLICLRCGAPIDGGKSKCEYCGTEYR